MSRIEFSFFYFYRRRRFKSSRLSRIDEFLDLCGCRVIDFQRVRFFAMVVRRMTPEQLIDFLEDLTRLAHLIRLSFFMMVVPTWHAMRTVRR